jgi:hypothetical protein
MLDQSPALKFKFYQEVTRHSRSLTPLVGAALVESHLPMLPNPRGPSQACYTIFLP